MLKKSVTFKEETQTVTSIEMGEVNLATAVALTDKPRMRQFWNGSEIKRIRGLYSNIRRSLGKTSQKEIGSKERRIVNQKLYIITNQIIAYTNRFPKSVIVM